MPKALARMTAFERPRKFTAPALSRHRRPSETAAVGFGLTVRPSRWRRGIHCHAGSPHVSNLHYFFAGAALSAGVGVPSAFHVSRTYSHFPPFFMETERYFPVSTTFPALSFTA
jgi:hypothetical protein